MALKRILQLSTGHLGGAGIAARNLNSGLNEIGVHSTFVATNQTNYQVRSSESAIERNFSKALVGRANSIANMHISSRSVFTLSSSSSNLEEILRIARSPDETILHIHNWFNLLSIRDIESLLESGYNTVFTLHDERLLTGGCHSTLGCKMYISGCVKCPEISSPLDRLVSANHKRQLILFKKYHSQITFVAPSTWISNQAKFVYGDLGLRLVDINNYIPVPEKEKISPLLTPEKSLTLGIANVDPQSFIKGGDRLHKIKLLIQRDNLDIRFIEMRDYSRDQHTKSNFWTSLDYLLITSRSENSPNIIFEGKGFGVPIIATDVGGIRELLNLDYDILIDFSSEETVIDLLRNLQKIPKGNRFANQQIEWAQSRARDSLRKHSLLYSAISE
jgi:glycosyltransferase involved in cell wall biosynthesis